MNDESICNSNRKFHQINNPEKNNNANTLVSPLEIIKVCNCIFYPVYFLINI